MNEIDNKVKDLIEELFHDNCPRCSKYLDISHYDIFAMQSGFRDSTPIEQLMYLSLIKCFSQFCKYDVVVNSQKQIGPYRVDFFIYTKNVEIVIECDGHEFHERTKEQASLDKRRDRYFQYSDVYILRFTGSDIWTDSMSCANEVVKFINEKEETLHNYKVVPMVDSFKSTIAHE